jgi:hypothetical protein
MSLITTLQQNPSKKRLFKEKEAFRVFVRKTGKGLAGNLVERVELYLKPKVDEKRLLI